MIDALSPHHNTRTSDSKTAHPKRRSLPHIEMIVWGSIVGGTTLILILWHFLFAPPRITIATNPEADRVEAVFKNFMNDTAANYRAIRNTGTTKPALLSQESIDRLSAELNALNTNLASTSTTTISHTTNETLE